MKRIIICGLALLVALIHIGCSGIGATQKVSENAKPYVNDWRAFEDQGSNFNVENIDLNLRDNFLKITGAFRYEYMDWMISRRDMAFKVYDRAIPGYVRQIAPLCSSKDGLKGYNIVLKVPVVIDEALYRRELACIKLNAGYCHPSPRRETYFQFIIDKKTAEIYSRLGINTTTLKERMAIIIEDKERIQ